MKICFACDLHLPFDKNALQYDVLRWAINDIVKKQPGCVVFAGDATCDGNEEAYDFFVQSMLGTKIPFLYIPGNSDLRSNESENSIKRKASPCKTIINNLSIFAINDCDSTISTSQLKELDLANENSIVFMHHPLECHDKNSLEYLIKWRKLHKDTLLVYGHLHKFEFSGNTICLQAMDPDKAIGESPCITYYDTETKKCRKSYYFSPVPTDIYNYLGISCFNPLQQINYAIENGLKHLELRPDCLNVDKEILLSSINNWRNSGGETLSIHLLDVGWANGKILTSENHKQIIDLVKYLKADRVTQHVPMVSVKEVNENGLILESICDFLAKEFNRVDHNFIIGVENMHMTNRDNADDNRRFGYLPEECLLFMTLLSKKCKHKVGINFDVGHARNNAPYSQKYQISTWLSMVGKHVVGYHVHQVNNDNGVFRNHVQIDDVYGNLISYASFFKYWSTHRINKAPVIFEMREQTAYEITLSTFNRYKNKSVFDLHSHTYYSNCGRDKPCNLIETAIENGLSVFGICDHNYGIADRKKEYLAEINALKQVYADKIKLFCGIEIATLSDLYDIKSIEELKDFDYCLIENVDDKNSLIYDNLFEYCDSLGILCGIAHTDLFSYCDKKGYEYEEFFGEMAKRNIFWELNVSFDSIHGYREHEYVLEFLENTEKQKIIKDANVYISVGFDSHRIEDYDGAKVHSIYDFLTLNNINTVDKILSNKKG